MMIFASRSVRLRTGFVIPFPLPQISNNTTTQIDDYEQIIKDKEEEVKKVIEAAGGVTEEAKELARAVRREGWILEKLLSKLDKTEERLVFLEKKTGDYINWGYSK
jgi:endonuclease III